MRQATAVRVEGAPTLARPRHVRLMGGGYDPYFVRYPEPTAEEIARNNLLQLERDRARGIFGKRRVRQQ